MTPTTLARIRRHPHLSADDLAPLLGISARTIRRVRASERRTPTSRNRFPWTKAEDAALRRGLRRIPGRTAIAVRWRCQRLGLLTPRGRPWTPAEDAVLRTGGVCLRSWAEVAAEIGRSRVACIKRAARLRGAQ